MRWTAHWAWRGGLAIGVAAGGWGGLSCAPRAGEAGGGGRAEYSPAEYALPEPDPSLRFTVQDRLQAYGLQQVVAKVAVDRTGKLTLLELLTPDLTPAMVEELRQAFASCPWKPAVGKDGQPKEGEVTLLFNVK